jgi:hypothetical protein
MDLEVVGLSLGLINLIFSIRGEMEGHGGTGILDAAVFDSCF